MAEPEIARKLTVIFYADVAGYSRLMGFDEVGTHRTVSERLDDLTERIAASGGTVLRYAGDAVLATFDSAVAAVETAAEAQSRIADDDRGVDEDRRIRFRIGVNLGEVIVDRNEVFGDGVNLAARLEAAAEAGGVCISAAVHDQVAGKVDAEFEDGGEREFKNIARPVRVYHWRSEADVRPKPAATEAGRAPATEKPSIAVLPFDNISGDPEQEYFSDGITEDIITDLSKVSALFVIARNSSFTYKGQAVDVKHVARDLGVKFVLEGSVRKVANRVRITAQLIDGASGGHLWAERYDRDLDDIFAVQDEVTRQIVEALKVTINVDERDRIGGPPTDNLEAYDYVLRGRELLFRYTSAETNAEARAMFESAIALDPDFATAHARLAVARFLEYTNGWNDASDETLEEGLRSALTAVERDPQNPEAQWALSLGYTWKRDLDGAIAESETAVRLDPNHSQAHASLGYIMSYAGRADEAIENLIKALRLDPQHPDIWLHFLAHAHFVQGAYEEAATLSCAADPDQSGNRHLAGVAGFVLRALGTRGGRARRMGQGARSQSRILHRAQGADTSVQEPRRLGTVHRRPSQGRRCGRVTG